jgi:hypothetical protein
LVVHITQLLPPAPQALSALPGSQRVPEQQPLPHELGSQMQLPVDDEQCCPL